MRPIRIISIQKKLFKRIYVCIVFFLPFIIYFSLYANYRMLKRLPVKLCALTFTDELDISLVSSKINTERNQLQVNSFI